MSDILKISDRVSKYSLKFSVQWLYLCWRLIVCGVRQTQIATHVVVRADVLRPRNIAAAGWALGVLVKGFY